MSDSNNDQNQMNEENNNSHHDEETKLTTEEEIKPETDGDGKSGVASESDEQKKLESDDETKIETEENTSQDEENQDNQSAEMLDNQEPNSEESSEIVESQTEERPSSQDEVNEESEQSQTKKKTRSKAKEELSNYDQFKMKRKKKFIDRCRDASIVRKIVFVLIILFIALIIYGGKSMYDYVRAGLAPADPENDEMIEVEIPLGSSSSTIANILEESGIITDGFMYRLFLKINNYADFQAGDYNLSPSMTLAEISETLQTGSVMENALFTVTIPEGRTMEEIAELYENNTNINADEFIELMQDEDYINELIDLYPNILSEEILQDGIRYPLEGYLFAATYPIYNEDTSIDEVVRMMLDRTEEVVLSYYDEINQLDDFSLHEIMTFSSLVEREARDEEERKLISGVFYNRLAEGMRLETDPTVLYALGEHKDRVLLSDLEIESPYNTYHVYGLPIGPISNFGVSSLEAVIEPTETSYLFFVAAPDGEIYYSETFEEHRELANEHLDRDV